MNEFLLEKYHDLLKNESIDPKLYDEFRVKRGLRNDNGTGVLVGLTKVAEVSGYTVCNDEIKPKKGNLYYRGIDITKVSKMCGDDFGYENTCFLLLFGHYPNPIESKIFQKIIRDNYDLPENFLENIILKNPSKSLMNHITRCILSLYSFDDNPDDIDPYSLILKGISLIAKMPAIISYSLQAKTHYLDHDSLHIHFPRHDYSFAENILYLSRNDGQFTKLEAKTLDMCLMVHADHGGGNNSAFVGTVVSSTLTDIYSMVCASLCSLKGPRHGGANMAVLDMMQDVINDVGLDATDEQINEIIERLLNKDYFDKTGLIYGIGHAIYSLSDPRCELLRAEAKMRAGDNAGAADDINLLRERAQCEYLVQASDVSVDLILDERARELVYEECRWNTLLRMGGTVAVDRIKKYAYWDDPRTTLTRDFNLWPIPQVVIDTNKDVVMEQNPGWN